MAMAKKYEFKPDKLQAGFFSKLFLTRQQRLSLLKWLLYSLVLLVLSVLQDVILCRIRLFGATTELVPCGIFLICILEGSEKGSIFALSSALIYLFSGTAAGVYSVVFLTVLGIGSAIFRQSYLQKGFGAVMLCVCLAMLLYELLVFAVGTFLGLTTIHRLGAFILTAALSLIFAPALYPILKSIGTIGGDAWKE